MKIRKIKVLLPGAERQVSFFLDEHSVKDKSILVMGENLLEVVKLFKEEEADKVINIVEDHDHLMLNRLQLSNDDASVIKLMDYAATDFGDESFDIVYAQASISLKKRNKILKEIKRILKPGGIFVAGEISYETEKPPKFVVDIWESSEIAPLYKTQFEPLYARYGFITLRKNDYAYTVKEYFEETLLEYKKVADRLSEQEQSYYKKLINRITHQANAFSKMGGDYHTGFEVFVTRLDK